MPIAKSIALESSGYHCVHACNLHPEMTELSFKNVSVSEVGDYVQVSFDDEEFDESLDLDELLARDLLANCSNYFLLQRQFEFADRGYLSVESHLHRLCGEFRISKAVLSKGLFCLEIRSRPPEMVQIRFQADHTTFKQLGRVLKMMLPALIIRPN